MRTTVALVLSVLAIAGAVLYASESAAQGGRRELPRGDRRPGSSRADMLSRENLLHEFLLTAAPRRSSRSTRSTGARRLPSRGARVVVRQPRRAGDSRPPERGGEALEPDRRTEISSRTDGQEIPNADYAHLRESVVQDFVKRQPRVPGALDDAPRRGAEGRRARPRQAHHPAQRRVRRDRPRASRRTAAAPAPPRGAPEAAREDAERRYADGQARFGEAMQVAENQSEGHELLTRHLEAGDPDAAITRPRSATTAPTASSPPSRCPRAPPLAEPLEHAKPRSCLAVRLSRPVDQGPTSDEILTCEVCGAQEGESTCQPLLVGGEVIGSVLDEQRARRRATPSAAASTTPSPRRRRCSPTCATSRWPSSAPRPTRSPACPTGARSTTPQAPGRPAPAARSRRCRRPHRPRPLQGDQRHVRPRARRRGAGRASAPDAHRAARQRLRRPQRRRGVRRDAPRHRPRRRPARRRAPAPGDALAVAAGRDPRGHRELRRRHAAPTTRSTARR